MKPPLSLIGRTSLAGCVLGIFALGFYFVAASFGWEAALSSVGELLGLEGDGWKLRIVAFLAGVLFLGMAAIALANPFLQASSEGEICLDNEKGKIRLPSHIVSDYLQNRASTVQGVESLRIRVRDEGASGKVTITAEASIFANERIPLVTERIQTFVETEVRETIGLENLERVDIRFKKIGGFPDPALPAPPADDLPKKGPEETETVDVTPIER